MTTRVRRQAQLIGPLLVAALAAAPTAHAEPGGNDPVAPPYPKLRFFTEIDPAPYALSDPPGAALPEQPGYWFITGQGLHCGIWFRGSFGCSGDIPGAPAGTHQLGWIAGDTRVHYDWTLSSRFPQGRTPDASIPPLSFISVEGTTCATTLVGDTYCERGPFRFMITADRTWLNG